MNFVASVAAALWSYRKALERVEKSFDKQDDTLKLILGAVTKTD
jgi:hypothetical protein|tara:strand:- start:1177 stop:1308 length:132 start_codon:yes stop_codon:yes gene_type:complete